jgi:peptidoglycan/LPS O-acetylase OafA/YrhL
MDATQRVPVIVEPEDMTRRGDIPSLTGLRGVAACSVLFAHAMDTTFAYEPMLHPFLLRLAYFGMSLFFVLSGFVIHFNYADLFRSEPLRSALWRFFVARFARLYPLYAVAILCSLPMIPVPFSGWVVLSYLTMTQSWFNVEMAVFGQAWSISAEWFFYLAFIPLTAVAVTLRRPMMVFIIFVIASVAGLSIAFALWRDQITAFSRDWFWHGETVSTDPWEWSYYFSPYLRALDFISGMLMAQAYRMRATLLPAIILPACLLWCCFILAVSWTALNNLLPNFIFAPALALVMLHVSANKSWLSRTLSSPPMIFLGEISYSIYIFSFFVLSMLAGMFWSVTKDSITIVYINSGFKVIAICAMTVVVAYGSYNLIEIPARRWIRTWR